MTGSYFSFFVKPIIIIVIIISLVLKGLLGLIKPMKVRKIEDKIFKISNVKYRAIGLLGVIISLFLIWFAGPWEKFFKGFIFVTAMYYVLVGSFFMLIKGLLSLFIPLKTRRWMKDLLYTSDTKIRMYHLTITVMGLALICLYIKFQLFLIQVQQIVEDMFERGILPW